MRTIAALRHALKVQNTDPSPELDEEICRMAINKIMTTHWPCREFTEEEIKNALLAYLKEHQS